MREARFRTLRTLLALVSLLLLTGGPEASAKERPWIELLAGLDAPGQAEAATGAGAARSR